MFAKKEIFLGYGESKAYEEALATDGSSTQNPTVAIGNKSSK